MNDRKTNIKAYRKAVIAFLVATVVIMLFAPAGGGSFKYKFSLGQAWQYDDLSAPFDFPFYKTDAELSDERKNAAQNSLNYFILDTLQVIKQLNRMKERTDSALFAQLQTPFESIYRRGILDNTKSAELAGKLLAIVCGNRYEELPVSEIFTQTSACEYLLNHAINSAIALGDLNPAQYLVPNLSFDESLTSKIRQKNLDAVLPTEGMIAEGVKIIYKGEVVTSETAKILNSLKKEYDRNTVSGNGFLMTLGQLLLILMCMACTFALLVVFRSTMLVENKCLIFVVILLMFFIIIALQLFKIHPYAIYAIPFTIVPIYISSFFFSRPAIYIHFFMLLILGSFLPSGFEFVLMNALAGVTAVVGFKKIYERGQLFFTGFLIFLVYLASYASLKLFHEGNLSGFDLTVVTLLFVNCLLVIILYQFTFLFERLFGLVSISRLVELADTNRKLFRELTETAPGTAQHVIQVANIAEAVIRELGGDPLLVRTGALYHDIGKMKNPAFFIENQVSNNSPHDKISAEDSAKIIIDHVSYGVELAQKHHLPDAIIDFIRTHHGKSRVHYFYVKHKSEHPDDENIESKFSYPGPNPSTKEMVALMMADSCEAASRSLPHPDEPSLNALVDKVIDRQHTDGLYDESNITLRDINFAKQVIKNKLKNIYHTRIEYPEKN